MMPESGIYLVYFSCTNVTKAGEKRKSQVVCLTWVDWEICPESSCPCLSLPCRKEEAEAV